MYELLHLGGKNNISIFLHKGETLPKKILKKIIYPVWAIHTPIESFVKFSRFMLFLNLLKDAN
jgi:hypothetical protein